MAHAKAVAPPQDLGPEPQATIAAWRPRGVGDGAAGFAREVVGAARPPSVARARTLLWCASRLAWWGVGVGLEASAEVLLHPSVIERFVTVGLRDAAQQRRRDVRTHLRYVARRAAPHLTPPDPLPYARSRAKTPYSAPEIDAFLALADTQGSAARRHRVGALVCLGAGAGLLGADLRWVRGHHIQRRGGGVVVVVEGPSPRVVPVLARYRDRLCAAAAFAGERYVIGGRAAARRNVTNRLVSSISGGADLPRIDVGRLRATWLAACAVHLGLPALFAAAGITNSQRIGDIVAQLPTPSEAEMIQLLGGPP